MRGSSALSHGLFSLSHLPQIAFQIYSGLSYFVVFLSVLPPLCFWFLVFWVIVVNCFSP